MKAFDLYLDESGTFTEGSRERAPAFPSQVAGLLAPAGTFVAKAAEELLRETYDAIGEPLPNLVHAKDCGRGERFDALVGALCAALGRRPSLRAVRLENREGLGFGTIEATYTRMIAELCVRLLEGLAREYRGEVGLTLIGAVYMVEGEVQLSEPAYLRRLQEHVAYAAVRRGLAAESARLHLLGVRTGSGRTWRELQCCDLLSNASHARYQKLGALARATLKATFGPFDWTLTLRDLDRRVDEHMDQGAVGLALVELAEQLVGDSLSKEARRSAEAHLPSVLDALVSMSAPARAPQLAVVDAWLEQLGEHRRDPERGHAAACWLLREVDAGLRARLGERAASVDPFTLGLWRHALTAANHRGALVDARDASASFDALLPQVAGRWELGPVITEGLIAQAVHLTDCLEYDAASARAGSVAGYFGDLSSLLADALPEVFPTTVRSDQRGRALGTQLQAEMYAALRHPERFERARELNEAALAELASEADHDRQHQYRAQLETYAGRLEDARAFLARSLHTEPTHGDIASAIAALPEIPQGFALLHWLRLGATALASKSGVEGAGFIEAWRSTKLHTSPWCAGDHRSYPSHGVRRYLALVHVRLGDHAAAQSVLGSLWQLHAGPASHPLMALIVAATQLEGAALAWADDRGAAERLLAKQDRKKPGAKPRLEAVAPRVAGIPRLASWVSETQALVGEVLSTPPAAHEVRDRLLAHARWIVC